VMERERVCVCVCVCVRERERDGELEIEKGREEVIERGRSRSEKPSDRFFNGHFQSSLKRLGIRPSKKCFQYNILEMKAPQH
jgi:hypothetical protein